jgi:hypothetical protein
MDAEARGNIPPCHGASHRYLGRGYFSLVSICALALIGGLDIRFFEISVASCKCETEIRFCTRPVLRCFISGTTKEQIKEENKFV